MDQVKSFPLNCPGTISCIDIKRLALLKTIFLKIKILEPYLKQIFQNEACHDFKNFEFVFEIGR